MNRKEDLIELFTFNRGERKGIIVLVVCIIMLIAYNFLAPFIIKPAAIDISARRAEIEAWLAARDTHNEAEITDWQSPEKFVETKAQLFGFDPNTISDDEWKQLGLYDGQIRSIRNYLAKGGRFSVKSDLAKMYVISPETYERLYPFIMLPVDKEVKESTGSEYADNTQPRIDRYQSELLVEINSADTTELKKLRGIGGFLARKIVEYRTRLGGFYSMQQLVEVYRMTAEKIDTLSPHLMVDTSLVERININTVSVETLLRHPYLTSSQAKSLVAYRNMHGPFEKTSDIRRSVLIDEKTYNKISPYLVVH